jgi:hypothetical protein
MSFKILEDIEKRFKGKKTVQITDKEFAALNMLFLKFMSSNNEIIRSTIDVLVYRLGIDFDKFFLKHIPYRTLTKDGSIEDLKLLMLTLEFKGKKVFAIEGGATGNMLNDLTLLFDRLVNCNLIVGNSHVEIDFSLEGFVGEIC